VDDLLELGDGFRVPPGLDQGVGELEARLQLARIVRENRPETLDRGRVVAVADTRSPP